MKEEIIKRRKKEGGSIKEVLLSERPPQRVCNQGAWKWKLILRREKHLEGIKWEREGIRGFPRDDPFIPGQTLDDFLRDYWGEAPRTGLNDNSQLPSLSLLHAMFLFLSASFV